MPEPQHNHASNEPRRWRIIATYCEEGINKHPEMLGEVHDYQPDFEWIEYFESDGFMPETQGIEV